MKRTENLIHEPKLTREQVDAIRTEYRWHSSTNGCAALAERYEVSTNAVHKIIRGKTWKVRRGSPDVPPPTLKRNCGTALSRYASSTEYLRALLDELAIFN